MKQKRKKSNTALKVFLFLFSLGIIPISVSLLLNIPVLFSSYSSITREMLLSIAGFILFMIVFFLFGPPVKSYVLEHELSHVLFAVISGVKVKKLSLRGHEGYVKTQKVNLLIALAPYAFPLYTFFIIGLYKLLRVTTSSALLFGAFYFLCGASLAFHVLSTVHYLQIEQPDLSRYGYFSSLIFIFSWSIIILVLIFALIFERARLFDYFRLSFNHAINIYGNIIIFIKSIASR